MHSLMTFLIIGSGLDQFRSFFFWIEARIPVPVAPITLRSVLSLCDDFCSRQIQNSHNYGVIVHVSTSHSDDD